ncbi:Origin recognition complex subunit 3 [Taenia crassiceps]|uniref:Origin recognition complex subunit 3 n=1 Tax=Taenia crassiceps TaxID=6207 RepID=A0ABR4PZK2_9CEST
MHSDARFFPGSGTTAELYAKQKAFEREWNALLTRVDSRLVNTSTEICVEIERYIHEVYLKFKCGTLNTPLGQIHTALLLGAVSTSDHMAFFNNLKSCLLQKCGRVAIVDCSIKSFTVNDIFGSIVQQCGFSLLNPASSTDARSVKSARGLSFAASVCKPKRLDRPKADARKSRRQIRLSNYMVKMSEANSHTGPLVVVIPAIESVSASVLREFVQITSTRARECRGLPIFFVFGLTSTEDLVLESHCDARTLSCLITKRFRMRPSSVFLDAVFAELFYVPGFRASRPIILHLIDKIHNCLDYSIKNLLDRYKLAVLKHYLTLPHPQLLAPLDEADRFIFSISDSELARLLGTYRSLCPLAACMEEDQDAHGSPTRQKLSDSLLKHWLIQLILPFVIKWVLVLFRDLHCHPTICDIARLYCDWTVGQLITEEVVRRFKTLPPTRVLSSIEASVGSITASLGILNVAARQRGVTSPADEIMKRERIALAGVSGSGFLLDDPRWMPCLQQAISALTDLKNAICDWRYRFAAALESQTTDKVANGQCGSKTESVTLELTKRLTLLELREKLLGSRSLSRPSAASSVWKQTLEEFEQWIFAVLSPNDSDALSLVPAPHSLPFCEVFYGPTGRRVHRALSNPECLIPKTNGSQSLGSDLCIVYKIYMEGGSLINVHDWLIAFEAIVEPSPGRTDANPSQLIQSRFLRAVADLEHMGLVRRTGRRLDHAQKLPLMGLNFLL